LELTRQACRDGAHAAGLHLQVHQGAHASGTHLQVHQGAHASGTHLQVHHGAHAGVHLQAHHGAHTGTHLQAHQGAHAGTHLQAHQGAHVLGRQGSGFNVGSVLAGLLLHGGWAPLVAWSLTMSQLKICDCSRCIRSF